MNHLNNPEKILTSVYSFQDCKVRKIVKDAQNDFFVIPGQYGPRWIVPSCAGLGKIVLRQWQPYNSFSKVKWYGLCFFYKIGLLGKIPGVSSIKNNNGSVLKVPGMDYPLTPVIYIGTPGPQQKAVVNLLDPAKYEQVAVMKVPISDASKASLLNEAEILRKLAENAIDNVPIPLGVGKKDGRTWQTVIEGKLTARRLTQSHINLLLQLPRSGNTTTLDEQQDALNCQMELDSGKHCHIKGKISKYIEMIRGNRKIPLVMVHGDFAPWNLKLQGDKRIGAIDWEDAKLEGLPLWDLCHFYFIQAFLFRDLNPVKELISSRFVQSYIQQLGLEKKEIAGLIILYLLLKVYCRETVTDQAYKGFLLSQASHVKMVMI